MERAYRILRDAIVTKHRGLTNRRGEELSDLRIVVHSSPRFVNATSTFYNLKQELVLLNKEVQKGAKAYLGLGLHRLFGRNLGVHDSFDELFEVGKRSREISTGKTNRLGISPAFQKDVSVVKDDIGSRLLNDLIDLGSPVVDLI